MYKLEFGEELFIIIYYYYLQKDIQRPGSHLYKRVLWSRHDPRERKITHLSPHTHTIKWEKSSWLFSLLVLPHRLGRKVFCKTDFHGLQQVYQARSSVCVQMFGWAVWSESRSIYVTDLLFSFFINPFWKWFIKAIPCSNFAAKYFDSDIFQILISSQKLIIKNKTQFVWFGLTECFLSHELWYNQRFGNPPFMAKELSWTVSEN